MKTTLIALLVLSSNVYADFKSGDYVNVVGKLIRDRRTGEMLGLVQDYTEDKGVKTFQDSYGYYILSKDSKAKEGFYKVVYLLKGGFTGDQISVVAEQAGEAIQSKYNRKYRKAMKHLGKEAWQKFKLDNWDSHTILGKVWRWPVALIGFGGGYAAEGIAAAGKYIYVLSANTIAEIKEAKIEKGMTRVGLAEFDNECVKVNHRVFKTIIALF